VAAQLAAVVDFVCRHQDIEQVSLIAHSWGSMPASLYAGTHPGRVERLVLFAPIGMRDGAASPLPPAWRLVTVGDQWRRFIAEVPTGEPGVLSEAHFADWAPRWLATDPGSETREPPANKIPSGPTADILAAGAGVLPYLPERVRAPVMIVRGEWDSWPTAADADRLAARFTGAAEVRQVTVPRGTHLLHLEQGRTGLYQAVRAFLAE
jgi:pimeloyl-ACP methyl ester carboxylesterase